MKPHRNVIQMKRVVSCFSLFAFLLASCIKSSVVDPDNLKDKNNEELNQIIFEMVIETPNDADFKSEWNNGDKIGLFVVRHAPNVAGELDNNSNYLHNVALTYNERTDRWTSTTPIFFPAGGDQLDFYAYYPYSSRAKKPTDISFNIGTDQSQQENYNSADVMISNSTRDVNSATSSVLLFFSHALSIAELKVHESYATQGEVKVTIQECMTTALVDLNSGTSEASGVTQSVKMLRLEQSDDENYITYRARVPAQRISAGGKLFNISAGNNNYDYSSPVEADLPAGEADKSTMPQRLYAIGDCYPNKTNPIGVVYSLKDATPNYQSEHGMIISVDEAKLSWGPIYDVTGAGHKDRGDLNTDIISGRNIELYPAFKWCKNKDKGDKQWYIPAYEELIEIFAKRDIIDRALKGADQTPISTDYYWSSTEYGGSMAWFVNLDSEVGNGVNPKSYIYRVRAVCAF